jgi:predicted transcriptional regulator
MNGANMSAIRDKARLNYKTATRYLMLAHEKEFIKHENGIFITTDKGKVFIEMATELNME